MQPVALLPPPFPSSSPFRLYISNMAVEEQYRRQGIASRLMEKAEQTGERVGSRSLSGFMLHAPTSQLSNFTRKQSPLLAGPSRQGVTLTVTATKDSFQVMNEGPYVLGPLRMVLMTTAMKADKKALVFCQGKGPGGQPNNVSGQVRKSDGVFVWGAKDD
eukprot:gene22578-29709_t